MLMRLMVSGAGVGARDGSREPMGVLLSEVV